MEAAGTMFMGNAIVKFGYTERRASVTSQGADVCERDAHHRVAVEEGVHASEEQ